METKKSEQTNRVEPKKSERQSTSRQRAANGSDSMASGVGSPVAGLGLRKLPPIVHVKLPSVVTFDESIRVATANQTVRLWIVNTHQIPFSFMMTMRTMMIIIILMIIILTMTASPRPKWTAPDLHLMIHCNRIRCDCPR